MSTKLHHRTHYGEWIKGKRVQAARNKVAEDWAAMCRAIRREDAYASHVDEATKDKNLADGLAFAERIRTGEEAGFTIWQRINTELTGDCVALLK